MSDVAPLSPVQDWLAQANGTFVDTVGGGTATLTRTTPKTVLDTTTGVISDVASGVGAARPWACDKAGAGGSALVIERARTNLFLRSYIAGATALAAWTADAGLTAALNGSSLYSPSSAANLAADGSNRAFWQVATMTAATYTASFFVRRTDGAAVTSADCAVCAAAGTSTPVGTLQSTTFLACGGGWYRAYCRLTFSAASWAVGVAVKANKTVIVDCFQLEASPSNTATITSYIPTTTASLTRNDDNMTIPTTGWVKSTGTIVVIGVLPIVGARWVNSTTNFRILVANSSTQLGLITSKEAGGAQTATYTTTGGIVAVFAGTWDSTVPSTQAYVNGASGTAANAAVATTANWGATAFLGSQSGTVGHIDNALHRVIVYGTCLTGQQLIDSLNSLLNGPVEHYGTGAAGSISGAQGAVTAESPDTGSAGSVAGCSGAVTTESPGTGAAGAVSGAQGAADYYESPGQGSAGSVAGCAGAATAESPATGAAGAASGAFGDATAEAPAAQEATGAAGSTSGAAGTAASESPATGAAGSCSGGQGQAAAETNAIGAAGSISGAQGAAVCRNAYGIAGSRSGAQGAVFCEDPVTGLVGVLSGAGGWVTAESPASGAAGSRSGLSGAVTSELPGSGTAGSVSGSEGAGTWHFPDLALGGEMREEAGPTGSMTVAHDLAGDMTAGNEQTGSMTVMHDLVGSMSVTQDD
jgi:hypothetical protein